jgi:beta-lactamase superfamily II metal-dependent hydrolase
MFRVEYLPAQQGDAIWIEYGARHAAHRVLIDAGTAATAPFVRQRIESLNAADRRLDLIVVTHVDTDHIGGILKLLSNPPAGLRLDDVWFNAWPQIRNARSSQLGPVDGEILTTALRKLKFPWNVGFDGAAVMVPLKGKPPERRLRGGMKLTVLSPGQLQLAKLRAEWKSVLQQAGLDPRSKSRWTALLAAAARRGVKSSILGTPNVGAVARSKFTPDKAVANGSTIALLAEFDGKTVLLAGDSHAPVLVDALGRLRRSRERGQLEADVFKVSHHGSAANVSAELLTALPSRRYVFSTSGAVFGHPDWETVARVIVSPSLAKKALLFNYTAATIAKNYQERKGRPPEWTSPRRAREYGYNLQFPSDDRKGLVVDV